MKELVYRSIIISTLVLAAVFAASAQTTTPMGKSLVGEVTKYDVKVNKILKGISVAELTLTADTMPNSTDLKITGEAVSKGTLLKIFRYSFLQHYESVLDPSFRILKTTKHDVQKERVRDSEAIFDYGQKRVMFTETDPKNSSRPPRTIASEIGEHVLDMVSAVYYLRLQTLAIGKKFELSVSDSGLVYKLPVVVTAREIQKTVLGNVQCFRLEPDVFGPGRLIEQKGKMVIWMTDDARHLPVHSEIRAEIGKIDIKLKSVIPAK